MPNKNVFVGKKKNRAFEEDTTVSVGDNVTFVPSSSEETITITFKNNRNPFNWPNHTMTGTLGQNIVATVTVATKRTYSYRSESKPGAARAKQETLGNPKLIVDGGPPPMPLTGASKSG